jgi:hypothetical protein
MDGGRVGWRSYECSLCDVTWENDQKPSHDTSCPLAAPSSRAAEALAELMALPGRWEARSAERFPGTGGKFNICARELRLALAKLGGTT